MMENTAIDKTLLAISADLHEELENILGYWIKYSVDTVNGGFVGKIDEENVVHFDAPKGSVLNARILWSFSAAFNSTGDTQYLIYADRSYEYIVNHFVDRTYGGVYWSVDCKGRPLDTKKQVYAIAFTIYGLAEYYRATKVDAAKSLSIDLFNTLVRYSFDKEKTGYFEAFSEDWKAIDDLRLSEKDANEKKTMNTHLHVLEAYTNLFRIWPDSELKEQIVLLINNFLDHMIDPSTKHLVLFLDEDWNRKSHTISFGHDIEAAWLLLEAAEVICDSILVNRLQELAVEMAEEVTAGVDDDGGMWYEQEGNHIVKEKHWWVQAEAMVGFFNAWQICQKHVFLKRAMKSWDYIKYHIIDNVHGEWHWGEREDGTLMPGEDKVGMWKCPYHNSRACMEIVQRIGGVKR